MKKQKTNKKNEIKISKFNIFVKLKKEDKKEK